MKLFFRENISYENPEGTKWKEIQLEKNTQASVCSCSPNGSLCMLTRQGQILFRANINNLNPCGESWHVIDPPSSSFPLIQISSSLNQVYVLDEKGSVYFFNNETNKWVKILKDLSCISLSISNKVKYAIIII